MIVKKVSPEVTAKHQFLVLRILAKTRQVARISPIFQTISAHVPIILLERIVKFKFPVAQILVKTQDFAKIQGILVIIAVTVARITPEITAKPLFHVKFTEVYAKIIQLV